MDKTYLLSILSLLGIFIGMFAIYPLSIERQILAIIGFSVFAAINIKIY